jgi:small redox-active disulfide protein 2
MKKLKIKLKLEIHVLDMGCPRCRMLTENAQRAARDLGLDFEIIMYMGINEFMRFGMPMSTPALSINGRIEVVGKVVSVEEIKKLILEEVPTCG